MTKKKKLLIGIGIVALLGIALIGIYRNLQQETNDNVIRIGAILPLSGPVSEDGLETLVGIRIAEESLNVSEGKKVKILIEDGKYSPKDSISALRALQDGALGVDAIIAYGVVPVEAMSPIIKKTDKPLIATAVGAKDFPDKSNGMIRMWFPIGRIARLMAEFSFKRLKQTRIATLVINNSYGMEAEDAFSAHYKSLGGIVGGAETFDMDTKDLRSQLTRLLKQNPDAVFISGFGQGYISAINQLKELGFSGVVLTDTAIVDPKVRKGIKNISNIYYVDTCYYENMNVSTEAIKFRQEYTEKTAFDMPSMQAQFSYEAVVLAKMIAEFGCDKTLSNEIDTIIGKIKFDENGEVILPIVIRKFTDSGETELVDEDLWKTMN